MALAFNFILLTLQIFTLVIAQNSGQVPFCKLFYESKTQLVGENSYQVEGLIWCANYLNSSKPGEALNSQLLCQEIHQVGSELCKLNSSLLLQNKPTGNGTELPCQEYNRLLGKGEDSFFSHLVHAQTGEPYQSVTQEIVTKTEFCSKLCTDDFSSVCRLAVYLYSAQKYLSDKGLVIEEQNAGKEDNDTDATSSQLQAETGDSHNEMAFTARLEKMRAVNSDDTSTKVDLSHIPSIAPPLPNTQTNVNEPNLAASAGSSFIENYLNSLQKLDKNETKVVKNGEGTATKSPVSQIYKTLPVQASTEDSKSELDLKAAKEVLKPGDTKPKLILGKGADLKTSESQNAAKDPSEQTASSNTKGQTGVDHHADGDPSKTNGNQPTPKVNQENDTNPPPKISPLTVQSDPVSGANKDFSTMEGSNVPEPVKVPEPVLPISDPSVPDKNTNNNNANGPTNQESTETGPINGIGDTSEQNKKPSEDQAKPKITPQVDEIGQDSMDQISSPKNNDPLPVPMQPTDDNGGSLEDSPPGDVEEDEAVVTPGEEEPVPESAVPRPVVPSISKESVFPAPDDSNFFAYFLTVVIVIILGYLIVHNKQKILGLIVEGRGRKRRRSQSYRKLDSDSSKGSSIIF